MPDDDRESALIQGSEIEDDENVIDSSIGSQSVSLSEDEDEV
jgi:hypothetical protein